VAAITAILGAGVGLDAGRVALIAAAMLLGQFSVGLSNDWIDAERDRAVGRTDKPVAAGVISASAVRAAAFATAALAIIATIPLGLPATVAHAIFIVSAWSYNLGLKSTVASVIPYVVSFGLLPMIVTLSLPQPTLSSGWAVAAGSLLGIAAHIANVLPDLDDDRATDVRGLPHRMGPRVSALAIAASLAAAAGCIVLGLGTAAPWGYLGLGASILLAIACAALVITRPGSRLLFRLIIVAALLSVVLLASAGTRILA
jgi:4-hydroxybenzoate polyprenyltransferase